jgi:hypothetical protein
VVVGAVLVLLLEVVDLAELAAGVVVRQVQPVVLALPTQAVGAVAVEQIALAPVALAVPVLS